MGSFDKVIFVPCALFLRFVISKKSLSRMNLLNGKTLLFKLYRQSNVGRFNEKKESDKKSINSLKYDANVVHREENAVNLVLVLRRTGFLTGKNGRNSPLIKHLNKKTPSFLKRFLVLRLTCGTKIEWYRRLLCILDFSVRNLKTMNVFCQRFHQSFSMLRCQDNS
jgi:hypothetical protein